MSDETSCSINHGLSNSAVRFLDGAIFDARKWLIMVGPARLERATNWLKAEGYIRRKPLTVHSIPRKPSNAGRGAFGALLSNDRSIGK